MKLPRAYIDEMIAHAVEDAPNECCGIIAGMDGVATKLFRAKNSEASPYRYNVDPNDLFRIFRECDNNDWSFLAIYHSHTASEAYPSPTDVRLAKNWPDAVYILVSLAEKEPVVRSFRIIDGTIVEEPLAAD
ncbi:MAG: M67 family metallopeptidase [Chloroflexota bacterium]